MRLDINEVKKVYLKDGEMINSVDAILMFEDEALFIDAITADELIYLMANNIPFVKSPKE